MNHKFRYSSIILLLIVAFLTFIIFSCKSQQNSEEPKVEVNKGFLSVLPIEIDNFNFFVNLGHMSQPGHIFPSGHGGFVLNDHMNPVPVFSPANMIITRVVELEHINYGYSDFGLTLSVNEDEFQLVLGHMSQIHQSILNKVKEFNDIECETYTTAGDTYYHCLQWTEIAVSAGDTLGMVGGNPGQLGLDFGTYDQTRKIEFATDRFDIYLYPSTVSPLDYFTEEIEQILIPICGDFFYGLPKVRTKSPVGGTVDYDIKGTAQGIWFKEGAPFSPEDPHIALAYHNVDPDVPIFSIGNSIPDLIPGPFTFATKDTGYVDRSFEAVVPDGNIYSYNSWYHSNTPYNHMILLLQMIDNSHLKIEMQDTSSTPPWQFTNNAVLFDR